VKTHLLDIETSGEAEEISETMVLETEISEAEEIIEITEETEETTEIFLDRIILDLDLKDFLEVMTVEDQEW